MTVPTIIPTFIDSVANDKLLLKNLLEEREKTALLRTRFAQLNDMDAPTSFFFGLEKKPREQEFSSVENTGWRCDNRSTGNSILCSFFYEDLYCSELCDDTVTD